MNEVYAAIGGAFIVIITYFLTKKKVKAETKRTNAEANKIEAEAIKVEAEGTVIWHDLVNKLQTQINGWSNKYDALEEKYNEVKLRLVGLEKENLALHQEMDLLKKRVYKT